MTTHEKKKMTRKEAIECFARHIPMSMPGHAEDLIDFYIEAGMLEIVEERAIIVDHIDKRSIIIKRNGVIVYDETK